MKAGYLQFRPILADPSANIKRVKEMLKGCDFDLIVLPELANSGYLFSGQKQLEESSEEIPGGPFCQMLQQISASRDAYIVAGICEKSGDKFYNSSILVRPDGKIITYRKIHLFFNEKKWFEPGNIFLNVNEISSNSLGAANVGMMICYDWIYPETARTLALKGAQIICHPSNLVMPYCQQAMYARAVENRVFTITANRVGRESDGEGSLQFTGESVIISPSGQYLSRASKEAEEIGIVEIDTAEALDKRMNSSNTLFADRREEFYFS